MDVRCDKCQARYRIDDARVGAAGLTMRCGKCGNTFKVSKDGAAASTSAASKPPPKAAPAPVADDGAGSTMMFVAPKIAPVSAPAPAPKPAPAAAPKPAAADDGAGSTMMFVAPKIAPKAAPAAAPAPVAKAAPAKPATDDDAGSTMMFGTSPLKIPATPAPAPSAPPPAARSAPASAKPVPAPVQAADDSAGSTMMFGTSPIAKPAPISLKPTAPPPPKPPPPAPKKEEPPPAAAKEELPPGDEETAKGDAPADDYGAQDTAEQAKGPRDTAEDEPGQAAPGEPVGDDDVDPNALTSDASQLRGEDAGAEPPAPKAPLPKGVIYGGIGVAAVIVLALLGFLVMNKFKARPPPPEAVQALADARAILVKDSIALFPQALEGEQSAASLAPKSPFPEAKALAAQIELAWSDALADESALLADKSSRETDEKKKADLDAKSQAADADSKTHHANALEAVKGQTPDLAKSAEVHLALADYYRQGKSTSFDKEIKKANALHAPEGEVDFVEGVKLLGDDDGAEKALEKLKAALAADPQDARVQYRIAQAQFALKNDAEEKKALEATLKLSPGHERAKMMLDALNAANAPPPPPPSENTPENNK